MDSQAPRFFLGANSPGGFHSFFDWLIDISAARNVYILKGGPGGGKEAFLRRAAKRAEDAGISYEQVIGHTDPDSLCAVILSAKGAAVVDGTAPHIVEPRLPGAVDLTISLDQFCNRTELKSKREEILRLKESVFTHQARAYRCLSATRCLQDDIYSTVIRSVSPEKIAKRARGVILREIPRQTGVSETKKRFLSGFTANGPVCLFDTARALCSRIYEINDNFGLSQFFLAPILTAAQKAGLTLYACYSPLDPENRLEHILIPQLSLGFVTSCSMYPYDGEPFRRIRLDPYCDGDALKKHRQRLRFERKTARALMEDACAALRLARAANRQLGELSAPCIDYVGVLSAADRAADEMLCPD